MFRIYQKLVKETVKGASLIAKAKHAANATDIAFAMSKTFDRGDLQFFVKNDKREIVRAYQSGKTITL